MNNLYQTSKILSQAEFEKIETALEKAWGRDTTYPDTKDSWSEENKAYGQCAVTSLIVNDLYGGKMIYDKNNFHIWNELPDGSQQDFSRKQFLDERNFVIYKYKTKEDVLFDETGTRTQISDRYKLLKKKFQEEYKTRFKTHALASLTCVR